MDYFNIYTDLDSLFDTRLELRTKINKDLAIMELKNKKYFNRFTERFSFISDELFRYLYYHRDFNILAEARYTEMLKVISDFIINSNSNIKFNELDTVIKLNIDVSKYTDGFEKPIKEKVDLVKSLLPDFIDIDIVYNNNNNYNKIIEDNDVFFLYDGIKLLDYVSKTTEYMQKSVNKEFYIPELIQNNYSLKINNYKNLKEMTDIVSAYFEMFTKVNFIPIDKFSINIKL